jgi:histone H3/H4
MDKRILKQLRDQSNRTFDSLNIELSEVLNENFQKVLENAVERMESEDRTSSTDIEEAQKAVSSFINEMYPFREERPGQKDLVRYQALNESKSSICPLWPIC